MTMYRQNIRKYTVNYNKHKISELYLLLPN